MYINQNIKYHNEFDTILKNRIISTITEPKSITKTMKKNILNGYNRYDN